MSLPALLFAAAEAASAAACMPRESFPAFVVRFKSEPAFRTSRIVFPLRYDEYQGGAPAVASRIERADYRDLQSFPLVTPERERELAGGEGELCESAQGSGDERQLVQSSCDTDVYGSVLYFVRIDGCWFLQRLEAGGS